MSGLFPLSFAAPALLTALALLIAIWWLLRLTPPSPREVDFPPTRLLAELMKREETPARSPWWLTLLRLAAAAAIIFALAEPIWKAVADRGGAAGPVWMVIDNGWPSATGWQERVAAADQVIDRAKAGKRPVLLVASADGERQTMAAGTADDARTLLRALQPRPYFGDRAALAARLREAAGSGAPGEVVWLADDVDDGGGTAFAETLAGIAGDAPVTIYRRNDAPPLGLKNAANNPDLLTVDIVRTSALAARSGTVEARDLKGFVLGTAPFAFAVGATEATAEFDLPVELRNEISRLDIAGEPTAAAVQLLDDRWRRRTVGLLASDASEAAQPLLASLHYLTRALTPFANIRIPTGDDTVEAVNELVSQNVSAIVMADIGTLPDTAREKLDDWIGNGGILIRFAGPRLATNVDDLIPARLRSGGRTLGGTLTWEKPQNLASFDADGPFADLVVPGDVTVTRQVLAEPDPDLPDKTWASLGDGTPLVTAGRHGKGWLVLFHVTADTAWSNLPLSGAFVEMLQRTIAFSARGASATGDAQSNGKQAVLTPLRSLNGFGEFVAPPAEAEPIAETALASVVPGRSHPPGIYGVTDAFYAFNLLRPDAELAPLDLGPLEATATIAAYDVDGPQSLRGWFLAAGLLLILIDTVAVIAISGGFARRRTMSGAAMFLAASIATMALAGTASAQDAAAEDDFALKATLSTRLAYVITGNAAMDEISRRGLLGLTAYLTERTALEPGAPVGVDITRDELSFFPLIYWPIDPETETPTARTMARIDAYMKNGGTVLFDTADEVSRPASGNTIDTSPATKKLRDILANLDIPPLEPVPPDHVLSKAFYLLQSYPGRWGDGPLWVEAISNAENRPGRPVRAGDGVSPILITANDFAGAWAVGDDGRFFLPTVPADSFQREWAFRVGVNIVMYTLTGNYKADQVHIPALLERLGQ